MDVNIERKMLISLKKGDEKAYEILFGLYYNKVKSFILGLTKDRFVSDDLAQNIFMKLWVNREKLDAVENLSSYLFTISRNEVYDYFRREASVKQYMDTFFDESEMYCQLELKYDQEKIEKIVERCVDMMPSQRKIIYTMSRKENLSNAEIAQKINVSKRTVDAHIYQALKDIRSAVLKIISFYAFFMWRSEERRVGKEC